MITVNIVFNRTASIVFNGFKAARHRHLQTETEHVRYFGILVGTGIVDDINKVQLS